jgi:uridine kinase
MRSRPKLIAIVGGSGSGKSWLSLKLQKALKVPVTRLSLDDFYRDQSHLPPARRESINFDHPEAIDWRLAEAVLKDWRAGRRAKVPRYSFVTHRRLKTFKLVKPKAIILVDGLWLLWRPRLRRMFEFSIFLHCPARLRLDRRLARDKANRGRLHDSVRRQFRETVAPMHERFVAPQSKWADVVLRRSPRQQEIMRLTDMIEKRLATEGMLTGLSRTKTSSPRRPTLRNPRSRVPVPLQPALGKARDVLFAPQCCPEKPAPSRSALPSRPR